MLSRCSLMLNAFDISSGKICSVVQQAHMCGANMNIVSLWLTYFMVHTYSGQEQRRAGHTHQSKGFMHKTSAQGWEIRDRDIRLVQCKQSCPKVFSHFSIKFQRYNFSGSGNFCFVFLYKRIGKGAFSGTSGNLDIILLHLWLNILIMYVKISDLHSVVMTTQILQARHLPNGPVDTGRQASLSQELCQERSSQKNAVHQDTERKQSKS